MSKSLRELFPNYHTSGGLFSNMHEAPWNSIGAGTAMDIAYLGSHSGIKIPAMFVSEFIEDGKLNQRDLAQTLWKIYGQNWNRLWDSFVLQYRPLDNYNMKETVQRSDTTSRDISKSDESKVVNSGTVNYTGSDTGNKAINTETTGTETENTSLTHGHTITGSSDTDGTLSVKTSDETTVEYGKQINTTDTTEAFTHGFNDAYRVPTSVTEGSGSEKQSGSDVTTGTGTNTQTSTNNTSTSEKHTGVDDTKRTLDSSGTSGTTEDTTVNSTSTSSEDSTVTGTNNESTNDNSTEIETISRERSGTTGYHTYQDMLRKEFELWKWNFFKVVFADCDSLLVLPYYSTTDLRFPCTSDRVGYAVLKH